METDMQDMTDADLAKGYREATFIEHRGRYRYFAITPRPAKPGDRREAIPLYYGDVITIGTGVRRYQLGSVIGYALKCGDDPIEEYERSKGFGHKLHWINALSASVTNHARPDETMIAIEIGALVKFEGRLFTIEKAPNDNLQLVPAPKPKEAIE